MLARMRSLVKLLHHAEELFELYELEMRELIELRKRERMTGKMQRLVPLFVMVSGSLFGHVS